LSPTFVESGHGFAFCCEPIAATAAYLTGPFLRHLRRALGTATPVTTRADLLLHNGRRVFSVRALQGNEGPEGHLMSVYSQLYLVMDAGNPVEVQMLGSGSLVTFNMRADFRFDSEFS
jgi:hypothetical protein